MKAFISHTYHIRILFSIFFILSFTLNSSQEINAVVKINYDQVRGSNNMVFKSLEKNISNYINTKNWGKQNLSPQEKIQCNFSIIINSMNGSNSYSATIQVQSTRPVYNSIYTTPLINLQDKYFDFTYVQNQPLVFNANQSNSNLVDVISYYIYLILGYDADSFEKLGGTEYFKKAQQIVIYQQQNASEGWNANNTLKNRYLLSSNLLDPKYQTIREMYYTYHRLALDTMYDSPKESKQLIANQLLDLKKYINNSAFAYSLDIFIDSKDTELENIFSGGEIINTNMGDIKQVLSQLAPAKINKWQNLK